MLVRMEEDGEYQLGHYRPDGEWDLLASSDEYERLFDQANYLNGGPGRRPSLSTDK